MLARRVLIVLMLATAAFGQGAQRRATNIAALTAFPAFYHARPIVVVGDVTTQPDGRVTVSHGATSMRLVVPNTIRDGNSEIRGEFWDLARMHADDPRLTRYDLQKTFGIDPAGGWPKSGEVTAIVVTSANPASVPPAPSIRTIVLNPSRYLNQTVTVTGQFSGRNLAGDLPDAPGRSRWDFVIHSSDAAIWASGVRPKGKDFDLALDAKIDTGRWLQVTGVAHEGRGLQWLDVVPDGIRVTRAPTDAAAPVEEVPTVQIPSAPPPEVVFSAPTEGESDVGLTTSVRIQFSRDIAPGSIKGHVRASYLESDTVRTELTTLTAPFTTTYSGANRVLELKFTKALERFRTLRIDLDAGILGTDQQPLRPWTLTFVLGGS